MWIGSNKKNHPLGSLVPRRNPGAKALVMNAYCFLLGREPRPLGRGAPLGARPVVCAFSLRLAGNMSLSYGNTKGALDNRKAFLGSLGINYEDLICAEQIHASNLKYAKEEDRGKGALSSDTSIADTDAFVTDKKDLPLAIFTADCLSIFIYDPVGVVIGLIHAGWRSTKENIATKTVEFLQEKFNTKVQNLYIGFGPALRSCCYEVSQDLDEHFSGELIKRGSGYYLDLAKTNKKQLLDSGVKESNIFDSRICTSCRNDEFFSYRKEGKASGRMISVMMLK